MSMHLVGPWLSTTSTKKRKNFKFKSAEHKRKYEAERAEWEKLVKKYGIDKLPKNTKSKDTFKPVESYRRPTEHIPS